MKALNIIATVLVLSTPVFAFGQQQENHQLDTELDHQSKREILDWVCDKLNQNYVFPDVAEKMENHVRKQFAQGEYQQAKNIQEFAEVLTKDLQSKSKDEHLKLLSDPVFLVKKKTRLKKELKMTEEKTFILKKLNIYQAMLVIFALTNLMMLIMQEQLQ